MGTGKGHTKRVQGKSINSPFFIPQPSGEIVTCKPYYDSVAYINNKNELHNEVGPAVIDYDDHGNVITKSYYKNGKLCRDNNKPAENYYRNGYLFMERWYVDGRMGRDNDKPAVVRFHDNGLLLEQEWYKDGSHYVRDKDAPNSISYYRNGNIKREQWVLENNKKTGRANLKPSSIEYHSNSIISFEERRDENGKLVYNKDKPTCCHYDDNGFTTKKIWIKDGIIKREEKYLNKKLHNTSGPALSVYNEKTKETISEYYLFGINYTKDKYKEKKKELNIH